MGVYGIFFIPIEKPCGRFIALGTQGGSQIKLYKFAEGLPLIWESKHEGGVYFIQFSPKGDSVISLGYTDVIKQWDTQSGKMIFNYPRKYCGEVYSAYFTSSGKLSTVISDEGISKYEDSKIIQFKCIISDKEKRLKRIAVDANKPLKWTRSEFEGQFPPSVQLSSCGRFIIAVSRDGHASLWEFNSGVRHWYQPYWHDDEKAKFGPKV